MTPDDAPTSLADVRSRIDALDERLVALLAEREQLVRGVVAFKADAEAVRAPARAEAVVDRARTLAIELGASPEVAEAVYRAMIAAFIAMELGLHAGSDGTRADEPAVVPPGEGRSYEIGPMRGTFKLSGVETAGRYCASLWAVEPRASGPGAHHHAAQEELFVVTEGTMTFLVDDRWIDAPAGTVVRVPPGVTHDFENRTDAPAATFNVFLPDGGFEADFARWASQA